jgi:hypothetical protein
MTAPGYSAMLRAMARRSVVFRRCVDRTAQIGCQVISERSVAVREVERLRAVLAGLIAVEDEPHPHGHTTDECIAWQEDYRRRDMAAWERARAAVAGQGDTPSADTGTFIRAGARLHECLAYLLSQYDKVVAAVEHIRMDTEEDRDLHDRAIAAFKVAAEPVRKLLSAPPPAEPMIPFDPDRVAADYQPIPESEVPPLAPRSTEPAPELAASFTRGYQLGQLHRRESVAKEAEAPTEPAPVQPDAETIERAAKAACDFYWDKRDSKMFAAEGHVWRSVVRAVAAELGLPTGETQGGGRNG